MLGLCFRRLVICFSCWGYLERFSLGFVSYVWNVFVIPRLHIPNPISLPNLSPHSPPGATGSPSLSTPEPSSAWWRGHPCTCWCWPTPRHCMTLCDIGFRPKSTQQLCRCMNTHVETYQQYFTLLAHTPQTDFGTVVLFRFQREASVRFELEHPQPKGKRSKPSIVCFSLIVDLIFLYTSLSLSLIVSLSLPLSHSFSLSLYLDFSLSNHYLWILVHRCIYLRPTDPCLPLSLSCVIAELGFLVPRAAVGLCGAWGCCIRYCISPIAY